MAAIRAVFSGNEAAYAVFQQPISQRKLPGRHIETYYQSRSARVCYITVWIELVRTKLILQQENIVLKNMFHIQESHHEVRKSQCFGWSEGWSRLALRLLGLAGPVLAQPDRFPEGRRGDGRGMQPRRAPGQVPLNRALNQWLSPI